MVHRDREEGSASRIALIVQYDGTAYSGFQFQNNGPTIQAELENSIKILTKEELRVTASGRTDSGVHALGQVVHFDLKSDIRLDKLCIALNGILPHDISVKNAFRVDNGFSSRFSAVEREYRYLIYNYHTRTPFMFYRAMWLNWKIDPEYIREAASYLIGEHDFASFCKKASVSEGTVRRITGIEVDEFDNLIEITVRGNAFLHHMIRIIVGTIVEMCRDGKRPEHIKTILEQRDRDAAGKTAPPYGLYLANIAYDPPLTSYECAF